MTQSNDYPTKESRPPCPELGAPVTVATAPPDVRNWGPYQFPVLNRLDDGRIHLSFHVEADHISAYGLPPASAVSNDNGRSWQNLSGEDLPADLEALMSGGHGQLLPNGDRIRAKALRSKLVSELNLPETPFATTLCYRNPYSIYRVEDLPEECRQGWILQRKRKGESEWHDEQNVVRLGGGETRAVTCQHMSFPWLFPQMVVAPDGSILSTSYTIFRVVDGRIDDPRFRIVVLRSTDDGRSWDFQGEIPFQDDPVHDAGNKRNGYTEPFLCFAPDGNALCLLRTTDHNGPGPLYLSRSSDLGRTWSAPQHFDDLGVYPQMLALENGKMLAAYGRPGLYVRATHDPSGEEWGARVAVVEPGQLTKDTCSYASFLATGPDSALIAYSEFNVPDEDGRPRKTIRVREVTCA